MENSQQSSTDRLAVAIERGTKVIERNARLSRRFAVGLVFGVGTALGASLIATIIIGFFYSTLAHFRVTVPLNQEQTQDLLKGQIELQTPQNNETIP